MGTRKFLNKPKINHTKYSVYHSLGVQDRDFKIKGKEKCSISIHLFCNLNIYYEFKFSKTNIKMSTYI